MKEKKKSVKLIMKGGDKKSETLFKLSNDLPIYYYTSDFSNIEDKNQSSFLNMLSQVAQEYPNEINKLYNTLNSTWNLWTSRESRRNPGIDYKINEDNLEADLNKKYTDIVGALLDIKKERNNKSIAPAVQTRGLGNAVLPQEVLLATNTYFKTASKKIDEINYKTYDEFTKDITAGKSKLMNIFSTLSGDSKEDPFQCMAKGYAALLSAN
jgi:hypothetical protein